MGTHTEDYRPFRGTLHPARFRPWPVVVAGLRVAFKSKLALLLLLIIPGCWTAVFCFQVYTKFALEAGLTSEQLPMLPSMAGRLYANMIHVNETIFNYTWLSRNFAIIVMAWFGSGLLADDKRLGAHLLYFARPLSRLDYLVGKFIIVFVFGCIVVVVPGILICFTAGVSSPDYAWFTEQSHIVWGTLFYGVTVVTVLSLLTLAISSLTERRIFALIGLFGTLMMSFAGGRFLSVALEDHAWRLVSPMSNFHRMGLWLLEMPRGRSYWPVEWSLWALGGVCVLCLGILAWRIRKLEVVG